ncbi:MBL fold metallo-hydrolase [Tumebacillus permanentifrigoris]|uniref:Metallo-beta-lactamase superfamily protein n=1 Tax=Tumebacillus permanentifrigoris TaxID=378543 RepID=A0A316D571_9BACL|nr:MBL fold metallo-hydrolase [Tumebacillus permanentifrigoris]PWK07467.1 metallo-beta-lactamase superfamily protein [Tumebacillus permanentifrigoris]
MTNIPQDLQHGVYMIDLLESGERGRTASYIVRGDQQTALIETGSSHSSQRILDSITALGLSPADIDYVIVTHIHLDHSGGVGYILPQFPNAKVVCHPRASRHLIDPTRLIAGASAVYGDELERIFGTILPVPEDRVLVREDGETIDLGGRVLTFYDTPGHARHHFSIQDSGSNGIFTGDTVSIRYVPELTGWDFTCLFPSTSPSEFDRDAVFRTIERLEQLQPERIYHTHFGVTEPASTAFERTRQTIADYDDFAREMFRPGLPWEDLAERIRAYIRADLAAHGHHVVDLSGIELDIELNAKGLLFVLEKEHAQKQ